MFFKKKSHRDKKLNPDPNSLEELDKATKLACSEAEDEPAHRRESEPLAPTSGREEAVSEKQESLNSSETLAKLSEEILQGPFSLGQAPIEESEYVSFGALRLPLIPGMQIMPVAASETETDRIVALDIIVENVALQLSAYACARSGGYWQEHLSASEELLKQEDFKVFTVPTPFGKGLFARHKEHMSMLIWGVEKDRWLLRGVFRGLAAEKAAARKLLELIFHATVVDRGEYPLAPGDSLVLTIPTDLIAQDSATEAEELD